MGKPFCPECGNATLTTFRDPPQTCCETCGWHGDLWDGHRAACDARDAEIARLRSALAEAERERDALRPLARLGLSAIEASWEGCSYDGGSIQEDAEQLGAIRQVPFDPAVHDDKGLGCEPGDPWFVLADPSARAALAQRDAGEDG